MMHTLRICVGLSVIVGMGMLKFVLVLVRC